MLYLVMFLAVSLALNVILFFGARLLINDERRENGRLSDLREKGNVVPLFMRWLPEGEYTLCDFSTVIQGMRPILVYTKVHDEHGIFLSFYACYAPVDFEGPEFTIHAPTDDPDATIGEQDETVERLE